MFQAKIKIQGNFVKNGYFHIFSCYLIVSKTVYISDILMLKKKKNPQTGVLAVMQQISGVSALSGCTVG